MAYIAPHTSYPGLPPGTKTRMGWDNGKDRIVLTDDETAARRELQREFRDHFTLPRSDPWHKENLALCCFEGGTYQYQVVLVDRNDQLIKATFRSYYVDCDEKNWIFTAAGPVMHEGFSQRSLRSMKLGSNLKNLFTGLMLRERRAVWRLVRFHLDNLRKC